MGRPRVSSGKTLIASARRGLAIQVRVSIDGWENKPAVLHYCLLDAVSEALAEGSVPLDAGHDVRFCRPHIRVHLRVLRRHTVWGALLAMGDAVHLRWRLELQDASGQVLHRETFAQRFDLPCRPKQEG
jgi:hypothetical protein